MSSLSSHIEIIKERSKENDEHYPHDHHHEIVIPHLPSALPSAQVTQAAFEDLRDIWRDTFDPGGISALGVILLIKGRYLLL